MRLPKRGERGFTLIELLIVVAILGVLAAVIIPNVQRFIGAGEQEARETELANIQTAVVALMVDNGLNIILPTFPTTGGAATNDMLRFPDETTPVGTLEGDVGAKGYDPDGIVAYWGSDKPGYLLFGHDIVADNAADTLVNYVAAQFTSSYYTIDENGTVSQYKDATKTEY